MSYIKIYDQNDNLTMDSSSRLAKILGWVNTGKQNGTFFDNNLINNSHWYFVIPTEEEFFSITPNLSISNGVISWVFSEKPTSSFTIIYGIY